MFYTRPNIPPLGLEFAEVIDYGGSCPSQFEAQTTDGRFFYIRYRGGQLSIRRDYRQGDAVDPNWEGLDLRIGPPLHGDILFEQVCDLAGCTIKGRSPEQLRDAVRDKIDHSHILDFSGRFTYWHRPLLLSRQSAQTLVDRFALAMPDIHFIDIKWPEQRWVQLEALSQCNGQATLCFGGSETALADLLSREADGPKHLYKAFSYVIRFYFGFRWDDPPRVQERRPESPIARAIRPEVEFAYGPWGELRASKGFLRTHIEAQDSNGRSFIEKIIAIVDSEFSNAVEAIDFATGESKGVQHIETWHSRDLAEWCRGDPNRFLSWWTSLDEKPPRNFGWKPISA
jgi:hypothetical protein